jgi:hypothetical protein
MFLFKTLNIKKVSIFLLVILYTFFSYSITSNYTGGDQTEYRKFYSEISNTNYFEALILGNFIIAANEPVSIFFLWAASYLNIDKDLFITFVNILMLFLLVKYLSKYDYKSHIYYLLFFVVSFNFYFIVLQTGAERLKFGYLFLLFFVNANSKWKNLFIILSILSHFQMVIIFISVLFSNFFRIRSIKLSDLAVLITSIPIIYIAWNLFGYYVMEKGSIYSEQGSFTLDLILPIIVLSIILFAITRNIIVTLTFLTPFIFFQFLIAHDRVNMIAFSAFFYYVVESRKLNNPFVLLILILLAFKSIGFILNIYKFGGGFSLSLNE